MKAKDTIRILREHESNMLFIHYSCESLNDENAGYSPRITSIAVLHKKSSQMSSFSMHLIAEEMHIQRDKIPENYNEIESKLLQRFFEFAEKKGHDAIWIHWNMMNVNFGFEALEHRYRVLTGQEPYHINENNRINLSTLLSKKYGSDFAKNPKMISLMELNGGKHRDCLTGTEEVTAFKAYEFIKMHKSTMSKVNFFRIAYDKIKNNRLRTETNLFRYRVSQLYQSTIVQIIGIIGTIGSIISLILMLL